MASTSNLKQHQLRNWLDLPYDVTANILKRVGMVDILENVDEVCTVWHKICMDPAMWRVVNMNGSHTIPEKVPYMFMEAVDRSQGQLVDITLLYPYGDFRTLRHVAERSSQLKRLEMVCNYNLIGRLDEALMKFPLLEELNIYYSIVSKEEIEILGHYCPMLKTLKVNHNDVPMTKRDEVAIAIGQNLHGLRHLELVGNKMTNIGLQVILDNCLHLQTLDLRNCFYIDMNGELGKKCSKQIKYLKHPYHSLKDYPHKYNYKDNCDSSYLQSLERFRQLYLDFD